MASVTFRGEAHRRTMAFLRRLPELPPMLPFSPSQTWSRQECCGS